MFYCKSVWYINNFSKNKIKYFLKIVGVYELITGFWRIIMSFTLVNGKDTVRTKKKATGRTNWGGRGMIRWSMAYHMKGEMGPRISVALCVLSVREGPIDAWWPLCIQVISQPLNLTESWVHPKSLSSVGVTFCARRNEYT